MSTDFRQVRSQAVTLWKEAYAYLTSGSAEPHNQLGGGAPNAITVPKDHLSALYAQISSNPDTPIAFWMGLSNSLPGSTPIVIVSNATGQTISGDAIYNGQLVDSSTVVPYINNWNTFCMLPDGNGGYENDYVFMRLYSYKWGHISTITGNFQHDLTVELVAHTVGAQNAHFDTHAKDPNDNLEGWIALDLLLTSNAVGGPMPYYDFVMPCPKICP